MQPSAAPALFTAIRNAMRDAEVDLVVTSGLVEPTDSRHFMLLEVPPSSQQWSVVGNRARDEEGDIAGLILVARAGAGEEVITEVREEAFRILETLETLLVADATWGVAGVHYTTLASFSLQQEPRPNARACELDFTIHYKARLNS